MRVEKGEVGGTKRVTKENEEEREKVKKETKNIERGRGSIEKGLEEW